MCGRYTLTRTDTGQLRARFGLDERLDVRPRYNVAPGDHVVSVLAGDQAPRGELLRWGLVPHWAADPSELANRTINARAETVAEKPAFRDAFARRRCLVLADGFFEWSEGVPHWITRADAEPFAFAGLWAAWRPPGAPEAVEPLRSCAIVTTQASASLSGLHHRMPVMLERADEQAWIDPATPPAALHGLLRPYAATAHRPVSRAVNDARHDAPDCLDPPEHTALF
jgi:putative SOS response-associated peptidase YedK